jgi:hypothetical protein
MHRLLAFIVVVLGQVGYALAQIPSKPGPPARPYTSSLLIYAILLVLVLIVCGGAMKSGKRSHQD